LAYYGYLGLYILGYVADDSVMVATAVSALGSRKLSEGALLPIDGSVCPAVNGCTAPSSTVAASALVKMPIETFIFCSMGVSLHRPFRASCSAAGARHIGWADLFRLVLA
jgi:hypothetical protein